MTVEGVMTGKVEDARVQNRGACEEHVVGSHAPHEVERHLAVRIIGPCEPDLPLDRCDAPGVDLWEWDDRWSLEKPPEEFPADEVQHVEEASVSEEALGDSEGLRDGTPANVEKGHRLMFLQEEVSKKVRLGQILRRDDQERRHGRRPVSSVFSEHDQEPVEVGRLCFALTEVRAVMSLARKVLAHRRGSDDRHVLKDVGANARDQLNAATCFLPHVSCPLGSGAYSNSCRRS